MPSQKVGQLLRPMSGSHGSVRTTQMCLQSLCSKQVRVHISLAVWGW